MISSSYNSEVRLASPAASTNGSIARKKRKQSAVRHSADSGFSGLCHPVGDRSLGLTLQIVKNKYVYTSLMDTKNHLYETVNVYAVSSLSNIPTLQFIATLSGR